MNRAALTNHWSRQFAAESAGAAEAVFTDLVRRYGEPGRHYHTLDHIASVLDTISLIEPDPSPALLLAVWLHDVVYESRADDNEERSADYVRALPAALAVPVAVREEAARLILLTKTHIAEPHDRTGQVLLDADLSILAAEPAIYSCYATAIRREYAWVAEADYRAGRMAVLQRFLARPWIYFTPRMRQHAEDRARANLADEIVQLSSSRKSTINPGEPGA
jgi:predicted metal-dependent HD superfamily phosphohydrolase